MHLQYLLTKKHDTISTKGAVSPEIMAVGKQTWMGLKFPREEKSSITIRDAMSIAGIRAGLDDLGFHAWEIGDRGQSDPSRLSIVLSNGSDRVKNVQYIKGLTPQSVFLPNVLELDDPFAKVDLTIISESSQTDVFLASSRKVKRTGLYNLAKGTGIEIGPGPNPQILNSVDTSVTYVEEKNAQEWTSLYRKDATQSIWSDEHYKVGKAHDLPCDESSLDFIFSSHVFEHLYNPIGHIDHWSSKLKPGGVVLGVIPATDGTKDFVFPRTRLQQLVEEYQTSSFVVPLSAYQKWTKYLKATAEDTDALAKDYFDRAFSIHVHVYDNHSINELLQYCVDQRGFSAYRVFYKRNSKDFIFALKK